MELNTREPAIGDDIPLKNPFIPSVRYIERTHAIGVDGALITEPATVLPTCMLTVQKGRNLGIRKPAHSSPFNEASGTASTTQTPTQSHTLNCVKWIANYNLGTSGGSARYEVVNGAYSAFARHGDD
jgi:hypothetical protein